MELFDLGNFQLSTGYTLPGAKLAYETYGSLNASKDNVIVFPNILGGLTENLQVWIGENRPLDPRKYFIILPGQFGNGVSSSPSNTAPPFDRGAFPPIHVADDVIAQQRLLTERFDIQELQLIVGWSVAGYQVYEWAVRFPHMVKRIAPIGGAPRPSPWTRLWLRTIIEEPLTSDPAWNNGFYTDSQALQAAWRRVAHGTALTSPPPGFYREGHEAWRALGFISLEDYICRFWEAFWLSWDPNNIITQARKAYAADPSADGDITAALSRITAKTFIAALTGDPLFPPEECKFDADRIPNAKFREIHSIFGHLATYAFSPQDVQAIDDVLWELLED
jgi:homoserine O-acetyltransferase